jgi:hypothetical protein
MKAQLITAALIALAPFAASAQTSTSTTAPVLGQHPAIMVQRLQAQAGYDYASKFYPHPAWLYLSAEAPRPMSDHPAVIIARRQPGASASQDVRATLARH